MIDINKTTAKYLVLDLQTYEMREEEKGPMEDSAILNDDKCRTTELWLRRIEPGTFVMGSPENELGRCDNEVQHEVMLTKAYYIGVFETTQKQYELITGSNPSYYKSDATPMANVSYDMLRGTDKGTAWPASYNVDETSFFGILRSKTQMTFDLPTEAQWEYACRAGTTTALNSGKELSELDKCSNMAEVGRYTYNGRGDYAKVGSYLPNAWGLYDMHGNVWEWCLDWYVDNLGSDSAIDPKGASRGTHRVIRGGSGYYDACYCRSACRFDDNPGGGYYSSLGFRIALVQNVFSGPDNQIQRDFEFEIDSRTENTLPVFEVKLYGQLKDGSEYPLKKLGKVEGDGAPGIVIGNGSHKFSWTPYDVYINLIDEVTLRIEYIDVTSQATYLVLDLPSNKMRVSTSGPDLTDNKCRTYELWLRRIEPGTFIMGSPEDELGRQNNEVQHQVTLTKAFYIGVFQVTQKQYELITGSNQSYYEGYVRPMERVSYYDIRGYKSGSAWPENNEVDEISFMGQLRKKTGIIFDLPTEAQWEYACRAGTTTALNSGKNLSNWRECDEMAEVGRYAYNGGQDKGYDDCKDYYDDYVAHAKVGLYLPNAWGLYDMHGNVWEWCLDWYENDLGSDPVTDPKGALKGESCRVLRGGSWHDVACSCRSASRILYSPEGDVYYFRSADRDDDFGFRVALVQ